MDSKEMESLEEDILKTDKGTDPREVDADPTQKEGEDADMEQGKQKSKVIESPRGSLRRKGSGLSRNLSRSQIKTNGNVEAGSSKFIEGVESPIIKVSKSGFSEPEIVIMEGMEVTFEFLEKNKPEVVQVIHDGDKLRPVIGGFNSKLAETFDEEGNYVQKFTLEGEYKFAIQSVRCTPLNVIVKRRMPLQAAIINEKFDPQIIEIDQGHSINWSWNFTEVPHSVQEVQYVMEKGCFMKVADEDSSNVVRTVTGNFQKKFPKPGLFFFQTESTELDKVHLCAVRVNECKREYKVEILDRSFNPPVVLVETGDRVWWYWDKFKCKKPHSVYQIEAPKINQDDEEPYVPVTDGFRWTAPSKQGLLSHIFTQPGVFYYSDQNFDEAAEYIGTIIVKPKPKEYFVDLTQDGFQTELLRVNTGERVWFCWDPKVCAEKKQQFHIIESEKCQNPVAKTTDSPRDNRHLQFLDDEALSLCTNIGYCSVFYSTVGVYHYRVANGPDNLNTCSVIVNPGEKNHTIHLTDSGPEQKVIMSVRPNDRVWWVWQTTKKAHNVIQVSHQGEPIEGGFCSGMKRDAPSAFVHSFSSPGVFYYKSQSLPKLFGAVVVTTQPRVHEVKVGLSIDPDPVEVKINDIVCWVFSSNKTDDVAEMETADQVTSNEIQCKKILKRRCLNRAITSTGIRHYYSTSFSKQKKGESNFIEDVRFSSVICDDRYDNTVIRVDKEGFHPHFVYIEKGESVRWTWLGTDQEHNIIHVSSPESKEPLNVIHGARSFNSGKMVKNNSFLYTFDEKGAYTVASQGAPGYSCTIFVINSGAQRVLPPFIPTSSVNGGTVERFAEIALNCETEDSKIFYTTDGSPPELHMDSAKLYKDDKKVKLKEAGLCFLRAMAVQEGKLNSPIFTSRRFWVLSKDSEKDVESDSSSVQGSDRREQKQVQNTDNWDWWSCVPTIKACFTDPGVMEVFWEEPNANQKKLIKGYQIFLNGVTYCDIFPSSDTSLNISGLAGNHVYEVYVEVHSIDPAQNPQVSNKLMMKCPIMSKEGGPVISLERSEKRDALVVVWMSIDSKEYPIKGYLVYLNEQQCGAMLVPDPDKNRCKVFIGGCELNKPYKIYVVALPEGAEEDKEEDPRISNVIEVVLPLDVSQIELPSEDERINEEELYLEYLSIQRGSGYLPAMDDHPKEFSPVHKSRWQLDTMNTRKERLYKEKRGTSSHPAIVEVEDPRHRESSTDQSVMTDDNYEKSTQTHGRKGHIKNLRDSYGSDDFVPPSMSDRKRAGQGRRRSLSGSESESRSESESSSGSETDSESDAGRLSNDGSVVVVSMKKSGEPSVQQQTRSRGSSPSPREPLTRSRGLSPREPLTRSRGSSPREPLSSSRVRSAGGRGFVPMEKATPLSTGEYTPKPPSGRKIRGDRSGRYSRVAVIEVQESIDFDGRRPSSGVKVTGDETGRRLVEEGEAVYNDDNDKEKIGLPAPVIAVESKSRSSVEVEWTIGKVDHNYELLVFIVNIVGKRFSREINSHTSFDTNLFENGRETRGVQHCWNMDRNRKRMAIKGLLPGLTYRIFVIASYTFLQDEQPCEIQTRSSVIYYTTIGPPRSPTIKVVSIGYYQVTVEWEPPHMDKNLELHGYEVYVDKKLLRRSLTKDTRQMIINDLEPGKTISVFVVAVTKQNGMKSEPSREVHITCPRKPPRPHISQQPSFKNGCVLVAWNKPDGVHAAVRQEGISRYAIFLNGKFYGDIRSSTASDRRGYQYVLTGLNPEESYDVNIRSIAGHKPMDAFEDHVFCMSDSELSNTLPVCAPAAPKSPELRLESMTPRGIRVTWVQPQQYGDADISGYQLLKNGKIYGAIMGPEANSVDIKDVTLGDKVVLQLIALTNHPVGKLENVILDTDKQTDGSPRDDRADVFLGEKYAGCRPGPKLTVHYTGLVMAPSQVWCEQVTGHSALVVWSKEYNLPEVPSLGLIHEEDALQVPVPDESLRTHFVRPDHYIVTWWRGDQPEEDIISEETKDDHLLLTGLRPATTYTIIVEARRMETYKMEDGEEGNVTNKFIMTAKSEQLTVHTARPPDPPSNLCFTAMTCHSLRVEWDPPIEHGVEVIGIRIDAQSMNTRSPHHVAFEVRPDERHADIEPLQEKTDYIVRVTAITDEYFDRLPDRHKLKKIRALPRERMVDSNDSPWLPNAYIMTKTAGTEPPANVKVIKASTSTLTISWVAPIVYGSNRLTGIVVRWSDLKNVGKNDNKELFVASHVNLDPSENTVTIEDLIPGAQYKIIVEAVVSIKTSLDPDDKDMDRYRRTAHIMSKPLYARARAPTEPPKLYVSGYTQTTAQLYWEKPSLVSVIGKDAEGKPKYLRRYLEGYKLEINDRLHSCLGPNAQSCQLTKCKPGKKYRVVLVALTCTDQGKKERKKKYKGVYRNTMPQDIDYSALLQDEENLDPSPSEEVQVILPTNQEGYIMSLDRKFIHEEDRDGTTFGDIEVSWKTQGETVNRVRQFNIIWSNGEDRQVQTKVVSADIYRTLISVTRMKTVYDIQVEPDYFTDTLQQWNQKIQIVIPGPPDPPQIFLKSVSPEEFVIEWGEPRLFGGIRVRGYQVYLNDKKVGNELSNSHRKAVIPCRPNRNYKVQLVALSDNPRYSDSAKSNTLSINTATHSQQQLGEDDFSAADGLDIPAKVTQVTESSIHMDWSTFIETDGVEGYKIQWSSVAQPAQREVKLSKKDSSCVINNCLPGTTHFVRLVALDKDNQILEKSKQMTIQTSAPPDSPTLSVRACNFRYIAVQWDKPSTYGDALVTGYKVYVNGIVEAILNADQLSFTFTHGKWCEEYAFQVQALTSFEKLNSKVSEPLVIVWPGCRAPHLRRLPTHSSSCIRVAWDDPYLTEGVKVKHFRACCVESDTEKLVTPAVGPIHPDTREAEFKNLKRGTYSIYLEVHLYGTGDVIYSESIHVTPAPAPAPPKVTVTVVGLEERRALEKLTCDLVNKRDRFIRKVGHKLKEIGALSHPLRAEKNKAVIEGAHTLSRIEEILENCFAALEHYTGQLIAHVSWSCPQSSSDTQISGFKVLIDGKQYGSPVHEGIKTVKIKLSTEQPIYKLSMITLSDKPQASSEESNSVDLLSQNFRPFCFYCYHSIHSMNARWPAQGCCKYQDSVMYERQLAKKLANQGLLKRKVPPPACSLLDIFQGEYKPILASHNKQFPTVILFWTPWCLSSQKVMSYYAKFAKEASSEFNFIAVSCGVNATQASDRKALIHDITANGWREDRVIWHCTSQCASSIYEATNHIWKNTNTGSHKRDDSDPENGNYMDLTEILGIAGVPTFLFIHSDGYIAWHGRYSAYDYASFSAFMHHTASEVMGSQCPVFKCDCCKNDMTIDEESLEPVLQLVRDPPTQSITLSLPQEDRSSSPTRMESPHTTSDHSAERLFKKRQCSPKMKKKKLSVNQRPYSASTYVQLLKSPYMQKTVPSPKVLNKLMRPQSGGARLG